MCGYARDRYKKVIALSTLSQLGIIIIIIGAGAPILAYFHLLSHAFFKAILFICAGMIIHNIKDYQDIRKIGLTTIFIPIITSVILVANIRLIILVGTFLTVAYSCRMRFLLGLNLVKSERCFLMNDNDIFMLIGIILLFPASIFGGIKLSWNIFSYNRIVFLPF